ncbi:MAG: GGDEF domain-containing protein [Arcobacter sp.]|uniref:GGDEF domain-containing protein n=1 Tax=unclassified Arcobacter TaxID=2593671 RepID=UPI00022962BB|nr:MULTISPECIES: GGDEF domain-containing protein [unclassified Arcobacter]MDY3200678.1 GGDEF domain-containing protein [Arcobacter sp.]BAK73604.1 GGDEF domain-containing protein [Arcobacter sp. L]
MAIHIYTKKEIENVILKSNKFICKCSFIYNNTIREIICKKTIKKEIIKKYTNHSFKEFIQFISKIDSQKNYYELLRTHKKFHFLINNILLNHLENKIITEELFDNLHFNYQKLTTSLNEIILRFDFTRNQLDKLTGAWNREIFLEFLEKEHSEMKRGEKAFSLVYFDIDFFKFINDTYSHSSGDFILKELIKLIKDNLREYDSISRWGGDEFLILLPNTSINEALFIINRIKEIINQKIFSTNSFEIKITCSFGIVEATLEKSINEVIHKADELLYTSKRLGRDKIEC